MKTLGEEDPSQVWKKLQRLNAKPLKRVMEVVREDGSISGDTGEVLQRWFQDISNLYAGLNEQPDIAFDESFYQKVLEKKAEFEKLTGEQQANIPDINYPSSSLNDELTMVEVSNAIDRTKCGKAYLDIPNDALKNWNAKLLLHKLFNLCFNSGMSPSEWSLSNIIPIPKPDKDPRFPLQNRCISILCCVSKVYSNVLNKRIQTFLESNQILVEEQNGFRSCRSCFEHVYVLATLLRNRKAQGKDTYLAFIDFKKAFDSVDRNLLFFKLASIGINGKMYSAITSLYANPMSRVILNEYGTDYFGCPVGVKQGDCLSPTLFAIFINDLAQQIKESKIGIKLDKAEASDGCDIINILLYADDIVCMAESELDLQAILFITQEWCRKWRLEVNMTKTNVLHVRTKRRHQSRFVFLFNNRPVPYCKTYKYLGTNIDEFLSHKFTMDKHCEGAERALGSIIAKMIKFGGLPFSVFTLLYKACVTTVSDYSAAVFGFEEYASLNKVQLRAIRAFLGLPKNAPNAGVFSEVNWLLPKYRTKLAMVRFYHRIIKMEQSRLPKKVFNWDKYLNENRVNTWFNEVRSIFYESDLKILFDSGLDFDVNFTSKYMEDKFKLKQAEELHHECVLLPKLRTFIRFKDFGQEPAYVQKPLNFYHRRLMSKIRLGCLPLSLETGRYTIPRIPEDKRVCLLCKRDTESPSIESEPHFLFECKSYVNERNIWYQEISVPVDFETISVDEKLKFVFNEQNNVKPTAQFIVKAFAERQRILSMT